MMISEIVWFRDRIQLKMSDSDRSRRQSPLGKNIQEKWLLFTGDCQLLNEFLVTESDKSAFVVFQYANSLLRSFGQVVCTNNPISGLIIIFAIGTANYKAMFAALLTSSLSFFFAKFLQQDVLGYLPTLYEAITLHEPKFWLFLVLTTLLSVYFTSAVANLLRYLSQFPIPCFTIPFNILQYILLFCLLNNTLPPKILSSHLVEPSVRSNLTSSLLELKDVQEHGMNQTEIYNFSGDSTDEFDGFRKKTNFNESKKELEFERDPEGKNVTASEEEDEKEKEKEKSSGSGTRLNWGGAFSGTLVALSQVYGLNDVPCAVLMFLAVIVYSPTTGLFCYLGSLLGTLVGISFTSDFDSVYNGIWGYNGLLSAGALAGFGFVLTPQSAFLASIAVLFCTAFQHFITPLFSRVGVPIFHVPFIVTVVIFLLVSTEVEKALPRPGILTYPEKHRQEFKERRKQSPEGYVSRARTSDTFSS